MVYLSEKGKRILFSSLLFTGKCDRYFSKESATTLRPFDVKTLNHTERKLCLADIHYAIRGILSVIKDVSNAM